MNNRNQRLRLLLLAFVALLIALAALAFFVPQTVAGSVTVKMFDPSWNVVANGGATMSSRSYVLQGTLGQPTVGELSGSGYTLISGFWADIRHFVFEFFLPLVQGT